MPLENPVAQTLEEIPENMIFEIDPIEVQVNKDLPRQRKDLGEIQQLAESISKFGQLLPVLINHNNELIAGGRRLAACLLLGRKVRVAYKEAVDPVMMRELELEENLQRKALTPAEECLAVDELVKIKQSKYGKAVQGIKGGYTLTDAANAIGKTKGNVIESIQIAEAVRMFPELGKAKSKSEIKKAVKGLERVARNVEALQKYTAETTRNNQYILLNKTAEEYLSGVGTGTVDLVFTDPPYGIDIHDIAITAGGHTGGELTTTSVKYEDTEEYAKAVLGTIVKESYRITKDTGHALIFCAPSHFQWLSEQMQSAGWQVAPRPIVWIKRETGQNNQPERWFSAAYEFILYARKIDSRLNILGKPDWIQCDPVSTSERVHQAEKPVSLCKELVERICLPGSVMVDPCMGSGALVAGAVKAKVRAIGAEKYVETYATAVARMESLRENEVEDSELDSPPFDV